jgi:hypothetical protein
MMNIYPVKDRHEIFGYEWGGRKTPRGPDMEVLGEVAPLQLVVPPSCENLWGIGELEWLKSYSSFLQDTVDLAEKRSLRDTINSYFYWLLTRHSDSVLRDAFSPPDVNPKAIVSDDHMKVNWAHHEVTRMTHITEKFVLEFLTQEKGLKVTQEVKSNWEAMNKTGDIDQGKEAAFLVKKYLYGSGRNDKKLDVTMKNPHRWKESTLASYGDLNTFFRMAALLPYYGCWSGGIETMKVVAGLAGSNGFEGPKTRALRLAGKEVRRNYQYHLSGLVSGRETIASGETMEEGTAAFVGLFPHTNETRKRFNDRRVGDNLDRILVVPANLLAMMSLRLCQCCDGSFKNHPLTQFQEQDLYEKFFRANFIMLARIVNDYGVILPVPVKKNGNLFEKLMTHNLFEQEHCDKRYLYSYEKVMGGEVEECDEEEDEDEDESDRVAVDDSAKVTGRGRNRETAASVSEAEPEEKAKAFRETTCVSNIPTLVSILVFLLARGELEDYLHHVHDSGMHGKDCIVRDFSQRKRHMRVCPTFYNDKIDDDGRWRGAKSGDGEFYMPTNLANTPDVDIQKDFEFSLTIIKDKEVRTQVTNLEYSIKEARSDGKSSRVKELQDSLTALLREHTKPLSSCVFDLVDLLCGRQRIQWEYVEKDLKAFDVKKHFLEPLSKPTTYVQKLVLKDVLTVEDKLLTTAKNDLSASAKKGPRGC